MTDKDRVVASYTAAADHFDTLPFWHEYGRRTVERLALAPGGRVLDLCCGTGAAALPAARMVGPTGTVLGVDLTPSLVERARALAAAEGLSHAHFAVGDVEAVRFAPGSFDAVLSVFGIFFADDMPGVLGRAWSWLAPGGRLAITVWGEVVLAPGEPLFWDAVRREDPSLEPISPAEQLTRPEELHALFLEAGLPSPEIVIERWRMPLASPEAFWPVILGTSNRGVFDALPPASQARVQAFVDDELRRRAVQGLDMEALIAVAEKIDQISHLGVIGGSVTGRLLSSGLSPRTISGWATDPRAARRRRCCCPTARHSCRRRRRSRRTAGRSACRWTAWRCRPLAASSPTAACR